MTRINVGVYASELFDQHLLAEYRELPRLWNFQPKSEPPLQFCLGKGHVLWCSQYPGMLYDRFLGLVEEMKIRGFTVNYPDPPEWARDGARPPPEEVERARKLVKERIEEKLLRMKPRYFGKEIPCPTSTNPGNVSAVDKQKPTSLAEE